MRQTESLHHRKIFCKWSPAINRIVCATEATIVTIIDTVGQSTVHDLAMKHYA